jgi:hypothetical protein
MSIVTTTPAKRMVITSLLRDRLTEIKVTSFYIARLLAQSGVSALCRKLWDVVDEFNLVGRRFSCGACRYAGASNLFLPSLDVG